MAGSQSETEAEVQDTATCVDECWYERPMHALGGSMSVHTVIIKQTPSCLMVQLVWMCGILVQWNLSEIVTV